MTYSFEAGRNILSLVRRGSLWDLETVSAPFVRHSHHIQVVHPDVEGEVEVARVRHLTNDQGFIRTHIYFLRRNAMGKQLEQFCQESRRGCASTELYTSGNALCPPSPRIQCQRTPGYI